MASLSRSISVFSDGSFQTIKETLSALKRRDECVSFDPRYAANGSFSMIGGRGATNWIELGANEIRMIRSIPDNNDLWEWASGDPMGDIYIQRDLAAQTVRWPVILISSTYTDIQKVQVVRSQSGYSLIDAIPYQPNGDYSLWMPDKHPEMWLWAYTDFVGGGYGPSHTMPDGRHLTFRMPLFSPMTFPHISSDAKSIGGFWVDSRVIA